MFAAATATPRSTNLLRVHASGRTHTASARTTTTPTTPARAGLGAGARLTKGKGRRNVNGFLPSWVARSSSDVEEQPTAAAAVEETNVEAKEDAATEISSNGSSSSSNNNEGGSVDVKSELKTPWVSIHKALTESGLKSLSAEEAKQMVDSNKAVVVDVNADYYKEHINPSVSVPLYRSIKGKDAWSSPNRFFSKFTLLNWPEINPNFAADAKDALEGENRTVIVCCSGGGTLSTESTAYGRESKSLRAIHLMNMLGIKNVVHLDGGVVGWKTEGLPMGGKKHKVVKKGKWFVKV